MFAISGKPQTAILFGEKEIMYEWYAEYTEKVKNIVQLGHSKQLNKQWLVLFCSIKSKKCKRCDFTRLFTAFYIAYNIVNWLHF